MRTGRGLPEDWRLPIESASLCRLGGLLARSSRRMGTEDARRDAGAAAGGRAWRAG